MANHSDLDSVLLALADPTRREVVRALGHGTASVGELSRPFTITLPSFLKHVSVLEASGLIHTTKRGRVRTCALNRERLDVLEDWLDEQRSLWEERTDRLEALALVTTNPTSPEAGEPR